MSRSASHPSALHRFVAGACALTIWLLGILALSPQLHAELHDDCCEPQHECAITLFHAGAENPAAHAAVTAVPPPVHSEPLCAPEAEVVRDSGQRRLPPSQAPPTR